MNKTTMTIGYQNRHGTRGDLPTAPKLVIANHLLKKYGFSIGQKVQVEYLQNSLIIKKLT